MGRKSCEITKDGFIRIYPVVDYRVRGGLRNFVGMIGRLVREVLKHKGR